MKNGISDSCLLVVVSIFALGLAGCPMGTGAGTDDGADDNGEPAVAGEVAQAVSAIELVRGKIAKNSAGEVIEVDFTNAESLPVQVIEMLSAFPSLETLSINNPEAGDAHLTAIPQLKGVTHLQLYSMPITDDGLKRVAAMGQLVELRIDSGDLTDAGLTHLAGLTKLQELDLACPQITDAGLASLSNLSELTLLRLSNTAIEGSGLASLSKLSKLKTLRLDGTAVTGPALGQLAPLKSLQTLDLAIADVDSVSALSNDQLENLNLTFTAVDEAGLKDISRFSQLQSLILASNPGVDDGALNEIAKLASLKKLDLKATSVTGAGLNTLAGLTSLEELNLADATLIDEQAVEPLSKWTSLTRLNLYGTAISEASARQLQSALPGAKILHDAFPETASLR
ncbi:MAG: hypothetical protein NXI22_21555 [bacterium]|nr:hypothetical protein [bacterium]